MCVPLHSEMGPQGTLCLLAPSPVENQSHCDFVKLRNMLIRTHMHDLKDVTCDVHYENYRAQCIQQMTRWVPMPPLWGIVEAVTRKPYSAWGSLV